MKRLAPLAALCLAALPVGAQVTRPTSQQGSGSVAGTASESDTLEIGMGSLAPPSAGNSNAGTLGGSLGGVAAGGKGSASNAADTVKAGVIEAPSGLTGAIGQTVTPPTQAQPNVAGDAPPQQQAVAPVEQTAQNGGQQEAPQVVAHTELPKILPQTQANPVAMAHRDQAAQLYKVGDVPGARVEIGKALEAAPDDPQLRAISAMMTQHVKNPWVDNKLAQKADLLNAQAHGELSGGVQEAGVVSWSAAGAAARGAAFMPQNSPADAQLLRDVKAMFDVKDFSGAERFLTLKLGRSPGNWRLWSLRAAARRGARDAQGAFDDAGHALALNPKDAWAYKVRSYAESDMRRYQPALSDADQALQLNGRDADGYAARAQAEKGLGQDAQAVEDLRKAAELDPQFADLYRSALGGAAPARRSLPFGHFPVGEAASAAGGLGLLALGAALLWKKRTGLTTRQPMRQADRVLLAGSEERAPNGFEIVRVVGRGGMGVVYEAHDLGLQRRVALKRMRAEIAADPRERRRFLKEARTVASLKHPNVIEIHSIIEQEDDLFLVFEYLQGETLDRILASRRKLSPSEALKHAREIAKALDYAHGQGVVHQDLKPSNVIVGEFGAKVMDFGIARRVQESLSTMSRGEIAGTPAYMSPEQERGEFLKESDLYAFGVCLYEMMSGTNPFMSGGYMQKVERKFVPLSSVAPELPAAVDAVIARALDPEPARRQAGAAQLVADLSAALGAPLPA